MYDKGQANSVEQFYMNDERVWWLEKLIESISRKPDDKEATCLLSRFIASDTRKYNSFNEWLFHWIRNLVISLDKLQSSLHQNIIIKALVDSLDIIMTGSNLNIYNEMNLFNQSLQKRIQKLMIFEQYDRLEHSTDDKSIESNSLGDSMSKIRKEDLSFIFYLNYELLKSFASEETLRLNLNYSRLPPTSFQSQFEFTRSVLDLCSLNVQNHLKIQISKLDQHIDFDVLNCFKDILYESSHVLTNKKTFGCLEKGLEWDSEIATISKCFISFIKLKSKFDGLLRIYNRQIETDNSFFIDSNNLSNNDMVIHYFLKDPFKSMIAMRLMVVPNKILLSDDLMVLVEFLNDIGTDAIKLKNHNLLKSIMSWFSMACHISNNSICLSKDLLKKAIELSSKDDSESFSEIVRLCVEADPTLLDPTLQCIHTQVLRKMNYNWTDNQQKKVTFPEKLRKRFQTFCQSITGRSNVFKDILSESPVDQFFLEDAIQAVNLEIAPSLPIDATDNNGNHLIQPSLVEELEEDEDMSDDMPINVNNIDRIFMSLIQLSSLPNERLPSEFLRKTGFLSLLNCFAQNYLETIHGMVKKLRELKSKQIQNHNEHKSSSAVERQQKMINEIKEVTQGILWSWRRLADVYRLQSNLLLHANGEDNDTLEEALGLSILTQRLIASLLLEKGMIPYEKDEKFIINSEQKSEMSMSPIPPSTVYYNARRVICNVVARLDESQNHLKYPDGMIPLSDHVNKDLLPDPLMTLMKILLPSYQSHDTQSEIQMTHTNGTKSSEMSGTFQTSNDNRQTIENGGISSMANNDSLEILFIHGLRGCALKTWKWIPTDPRFYELNLEEENNDFQVDLDSKRVSLGKRMPQHFVHDGTESDEMKSGRSDSFSESFFSPFQHKVLQMKLYDSNLHVVCDRQIFPYTSIESIFDKKKDAEKGTQMSNKSRDLRFHVINEEPGTDSTWHLHWPQIFLKGTENVRITAFDFDAPLFLKTPLHVARRSSIRASTANEANSIVELTGVSREEGEFFRSRDANSQQPIENSLAKKISIQTDDVQQFKIVEEFTGDFSQFFQHLLRLVPTLIKTSLKSAPAQLHRVWHEASTVLPLVTPMMTQDQIARLFLLRLREAGFFKASESYHNQTKKSQHEELVCPRPESTSVQSFPLSLGNIEERMNKESHSCGKSTETRLPKDVIWVAHSMGGLIVKYMLLMNTELAERTKAVIFFGVPHFVLAEKPLPLTSGSPMASEFRVLERIVAPYCRELHPKQNGDRLVLLNDEFKLLCQTHNIRILSFSETEKTPIPYLTDIMPKYIRYVVPPHSADPGYGSFAVLPNVNHIRMCCLAKPDDRIALMQRLIFSH